MKVACKFLTGQAGKFSLICIVFISAGYYTRAAADIPFIHLTGVAPGNLIPTVRENSDSFILLPVTIIQFDCFRQNKDVVIKWKTDDENELVGYEIQRSTDQVRFYTIAQITPKRGHINDYQFIDNAEEQPLVYYRLKIIYPTYSTYSIIKKINNSVTGKKSVILQSNIIDNHIELTIEENGAEWGNIIIHNPQGAMVYFKKQVLFTGKNTITLSNLPQINVGLYFLMIQFSNDKVSETSVLMKH